MPYVTVKPTEEGPCPSCGGPIYAGERAFVDARAPECCQWCSKRCYDYDEIWKAQWDEEADS